jgi:hypothetical protein
MKGFTLAALAGVILLSGCASDAGNPNGQHAVADRSDAPLGSYIKRKPGSRDDSVTMDKQALENERTMNNGTMNTSR